MKIKNMFFRKIIFTFGLTGMLLGCGTLPASGPYSKNIHTSDKVNIKISTADRGTEKFRYAVADIDTNLINYLSKYSVEAVQEENWPANTPAEEITVNVGDTIEVSIFESQAGGLFIPEGSSVRPGNFVSLPAQTIDFSGFITVPYAGKIEAAGKTTEEISADIVTKLQNKAIEPQVVVSFSGRNGAEVSVIGDVNNARRLSLGFNQYKILDTIASAGGPVSPGYETKVSLQRAGEEYKIPFDQLVDDSAKNIYAEINDIIYLYREPETFIAYGAVQNPGSIPFGKSNLMLSEALGLTRGLVDGQADPAEVYIYRQKKYPYFKKATEVEKKISSVSTTITASDLAYSLETEAGVKPSFKIMSKVGAATDAVTEKKKAVKIVKDQVVARENVKAPSKIQSIIKKPSIFRFKKNEKTDSNAFENQRPPTINSNIQTPTSTKTKMKTVVTTKSNNAVDTVEKSAKPSVFSRMKLPTLAAPQKVEEETAPSFKTISKIGATEEKAVVKKTTSVKKDFSKKAAEAKTATKKTTVDIVDTTDAVEPIKKPSFLSRFKLPSFTASPKEEEEIAPSFKAVSKIGAETVQEKTTLQKTVAKEVEPAKAIVPKAIEPKLVPQHVPLATKVVEEPVTPKTLMKKVEPEIKSEIVSAPVKAEEATPVVKAVQPEPAFTITESTVAAPENTQKSTLTNVLSTPNVNKVEEVVETRQVVSDDGDVALIFKLNMRDPQSFFLAQNFKMEDQDIVYVANAESVELSKFLGIIGISSTTTNNTNLVRDGF